MPENAAVQALLKEATAVRDDSWKEKKRLEKQSHNLTQEISLLTNQTHLLDSEASAKQRLLAETRYNYTFDSWTAVNSCTGNHVILSVDFIC